MDIHRVEHQDARQLCRRNPLRYVDFRATSAGSLRDACLLSRRSRRPRIKKASARGALKAAVERINIAAGGDSSRSPAAIRRVFLHSSGGHFAEFVSSCPTSLVRLLTVILSSICSLVRTAPL